MEEHRTPESPYQPKKNLPFRSTIHPDFPTEVQIQTQTKCNARCLMCPYPQTQAGVSHGAMRRQLFERIIDECAEHPVQDLKPFLMNEPLLDRRLPGLIRYARERLPHTRIGLSTNAQLLAGSLARELLDSDPDEVWVNFAGNTKATYEGTMVGLSFERARRNVLDFKQCAAGRGSAIRVVISVVETRPALSELEAMRAYWAGHGIPVVTTPLNNRGGHVAGGGLQVLGSIRDYRVCDRPFHKIYIAFNGDVILCSSDWARSTILGNVAVEGVRGVWLGAALEQVRRWLRDRELDRLELCRQCDYPAIYE